jgi:hypothetical protein
MRTWRSNLASESKWGFASLDNDPKRKISRECGQRFASSAMKGKLSKAHESLYRPAARAASTAIADSQGRSIVEAIDRHATLIEKLNSEGPGIADNLTEGIE